MSSLRKYITAFRDGTMQKFVRDLDAHLDFVSTRVGGTNLKFTDQAHDDPHPLAPPAAATFDVTGSDGRFSVVITDPQNVNPATVNLMRGQIYSGRNYAQTVIQHNLQSATTTAFDQSSGVIDYGISSQIRYEISGNGETRFFRLRSSFDGQSWTPWQMKSDAVSSGAVSGMPKGAIVMWSGKIANIPAGWGLCDGTAGKPDLRSKFIKGAAAGVDPGATGGAASFNYTPAGTIDAIAASATPGVAIGAGAASAANVAHTHPAPNFTGTLQAIPTEPVYFSLAYIIKL